MKIATWNVNSLKVRLPHVLDWLSLHQPDALCLQELKLEDKNFPLAEIEAAGYHAAFSGQKTYNGVAILSKQPLQDVSAGIPGYEDDQKRVLSATLNGVRLVCVYIPNGQSVDSGKYQYKLGWLEALAVWLKSEVARYPKLALLGDYNVAPEDRDVHDPKAWEGQVLCSEPEREAFRVLQKIGLQDCFRLFPQAEGAFTWWDYRMNAFRRKLGLRIDHILLSDALASDCVSCVVDMEPRKLERPSDHAPVIAEISHAGETH
ncbi:MAG: exodeoxyribonuclease III [Sulfurimicrobium sp.]|nr:exodeoxyribonuclease III [Sulfurimicrobium sp.]MDP2200041.1 exodeoxyribonuclease III [Sulfurimicrobium sp.]MDP3686099.1 exodeoxyribonuclease III [Sulfurimicrobium sp.]